MSSPRACLVLTVAALLAASLGACGDPVKPAPVQPATPHDSPVPAPVPAKTPAEPAKAPETVLATYDRGLDYLLSIQKDGVWFAKEGVPSTAYSAIAAAALFERPGGLREKDKAIANKAIDALLAEVDTDGSIKNAQAPNYTVSVVVMALTASGRADAKSAIAKCAEKLRTFQFLERDNSTYGGIGYGSDKTRSDLSNTQFALASLRAAGVSEDDPAMKAALDFLNRTQNRKENETAGEPAEWKDKDGKTYVRANDGGANYRPGDSKAGFDERPDGTRTLKSYGSMTYALLRCYHLAGLPASDGRVKSAVEWISKNWELSKNPGMPEKMQFAALYYMYATMGKTLPLAGIDTIDVGGKKIDWRTELAAHLAKLQQPDGSWVNSQESKWDEGNPIVATSFALTALSACKR
ncbi:MAG: terpene cyclase/mutase family protein [Planctomycetes bacterium]|nr:terpene cyclase/mutase family protein [Planctomycetota bacterium]